MEISNIRVKIKSKLKSVSDLKKNDRILFNSEEVMIKEVKKFGSVILLKVLSKSGEYSMFVDSKMKLEVL